MFGDVITIILIIAIIVITLFLLFWTAYRKTVIEINPTAYNGQDQSPCTNTQECTNG